MRELSNADLGRALRLSQELVAAADQGNFDALADLDAQRLQLLQSFKSRNTGIDAEGRTLLQEISRLNDQAIGTLEHLRRIKGCECDLIALGRRAVTAYSMTVHPMTRLPPHA